MTKQDDSSASSSSVQWVETACGGEVLLNSQASFIYYREKIVYFCSQYCKDLYEQDPLNSCMSGRILAGR